MMLPPAYHGIARFEFAPFAFIRGYLRMHLQCNSAVDFFSATIIPSEIHWIQRSAH